MITFGPFETTHEVINKAIELLQAEGFTVNVDRDGWETPAQLRERLGFEHPSALTRLLQHPECPHFRKLVGERKLLKLRSNSALENFLLAHKR